MLDGDVIPVTRMERQKLWTEMRRHLELHNNYARMGVNENTVVKEYMYCMGMLYAMRTLRLLDSRKLDEYEQKLYKPYE